MQRRREGHLTLARVFDAQGGSQAFAAAPAGLLKKSGWGVERPVCSSAAETVRLLRDYEDGPFYSRALIEANLAGQRAACIQEWAAMERFQKRWVQFLLPFKMRRVRG